MRNGNINNPYAHPLAIMHYTSVIVWYSPVWNYTTVVLLEIVLHTFFDVIKVDSNEVVSVRSSLFVVEADCMA